MHEALDGPPDKGPTLHRTETSQLDAICVTMYIPTHDVYTSKVALDSAPQLPSKKMEKMT